MKGSVMKRIIAVLLLVLATWGLSSVQAAGDNEWLLGKWGMSYDPDGSEKDWIEFLPEGQVVSISAKGRRTPGEYTVRGPDVSITFHVNGRDIALPMKYDAGRKALLNYSERTGHSAEYRKEGPH